MKRIVAAVLCLLVLGATASTLHGQLITDTRGVSIQGFAPSPAKSENQAISSSSSYTLTLTGWTVVRFYADGELKVKLNTNTAYMRSYGDTYVVGPGVSQMVFENAGSETVNIDIEGM